MSDVPTPELPPIATPEAVTPPASPRAAVLSEGVTRAVSYITEHLKQNTEPRVILEGITKGEHHQLPAEHTPSPTESTTPPETPTAENPILANIRSMRHQLEGITSVHHVLAQQAESIQPDAKNKLTALLDEQTQQLREKSRHWSDSVHIDVLQAHQADTLFPGTTDDQKIELLQELQDSIRNLNQELTDAGLLEQPLPMDTLDTAEEILNWNASPTSEPTTTESDGDTAVDNADTDDEPSTDSDADTAKTDDSEDKKEDQKKEKKKKKLSPEEQAKLAQKLAMENPAMVVKFTKDGIYDQKAHEKYAQNLHDEVLEYLKEVAKEKRKERIEIGLHITLILLEFMMQQLAQDSGGAAHMGGHH